MKLEIVDKGVILRNPLPGHRVLGVFYPDILCFSPDEWICVVKTSGAIYSPDGALEILRTRDGGVTWDREGPVRRRGLDPVHYNYLEGTLTALRDGSLVLRAMRLDHSDPDLLVFNQQTQGLAPLETCVFRSYDQGRTWSDPVAAEIRPHFESHQEVAPYGRVIELEDGTWFHTFETWKTYDDDGPFDLNIYAMYSRDGGRTWFDKHRVAVGTEQNRSYSHAITTRRADGTLLSTAWTAESQLQTSFDLHVITSRDPFGREWNPPFGTGIHGQSNCAVELGDGRLILIYSHRENTPLPGIKAALSEDGGRTWDVVNSVLLWDAYGKESLGVVRTDTYPSSHDAIAYGAPKLSRLDDRHALAGFWCTQGGDTHSRWAKLRIG
ncbi:MAG: sialidase family protein [Bryobacteraceae bacterium]